VQFTPEAWINASAVGNAFGKPVRAWLKRSSTQALMEVIHLIRLLSKDHLIIEKRGEVWLHRLLSIPYTATLGAQFSLWCHLQIERLLNDLPGGKGRDVFRAVHTMISYDQLTGKTVAFGIPDDVRISSDEHFVDRIVDKAQLLVDTLAAIESATGLPTTLMARSLSNRESTVAREVPYPVIAPYPHLSGKETAQREPWPLRRPEQHAELLSAWRERFGNESLTVGDVIRQIQPALGKPENIALAQVMRDMCGYRQINPNKIGIKISQSLGYAADGLHFVSDGERDRAKKWRVVSDAD